MVERKIEAYNDELVGLCLLLFSTHIPGFDQPVLAEFKSKPRSLYMKNTEMVKNNILCSFGNLLDITQ